MREKVGNEEIEKILGQRLWENGVYIAYSLDITMTVFQLKALLQAQELKKEVEK